ncbi:MAG: glycosyltransferase [Pirellulales bacterium]|nr:glycosyltransferase [Pirellulales bacterium]
MHFILTGLGSYGDVLPMAGLAATLVERGHRVQLAASPYFREVVAATGAELIELGTVDDYLGLVNDPRLWHPTRGFHVVYGYTAKTLSALYRTLAAHSIPGETIHAAHGIDFASRLLQERFGNPLATVHFAPIALCSVEDLPAFIGSPPAWALPRWARRGLYWAVDRLVIDRFIGPPLNALRSELGLSPVKRVFTSWASSPTRIVALFPEWFSSDPGDWSPQVRQVGFPLYDAATDASMSEEVETFLSAGEPPIVFAPGSANAQAKEFFAAAAQACRLLDRRGMLVTKYAEQLPPSLPAGVERFGFVPFSRLLPRAAAIVHHGGIGTCGQSLAAGIPQVVTPLGFDQLDNGRRLERLGVAAIVPSKRISARRLAAALGPLISSEAVRSRCRDLAGCCNGVASRIAACDLLEQLARPEAPVPQPDI